MERGRTYNILLNIIDSNLLHGCYAERGKLSFGKRKRPEYVSDLYFLFGADYGARTRHLDLGKVALYQMS